MLRLGSDRDVVAQVTNAGLTIAHYLAEKGSTSELRIVNVIEGGADTYLVQDHVFNNTPAHLAAAAGQAMAISTMCETEQGRRALLVRNHRGQTPLDVAKQNRQEHTAKTIQNLLELPSTVPLGQSDEPLVKQEHPLEIDRNVIRR
jgi:ankyrin repeat protein